LSKNDQIAQEIRSQLHSLGIWTINLIGSPGSGKTTLLEAVFPYFVEARKCAVIEGDVKTDRDMQRIAAYGVPAVQIQTEGACHLNAEQIKNELSQLPLSDINLLIIENVGNLICPVAFDLGEDCRAIVISVSEGEDKPLKYPSAFASANIVIITKIDLAHYVDVDPQDLKANALSINPGLEVFLTSAKTGTGIEKFADFLLHIRNNSPDTKNE
jgi:hydrogenase nickel incorporation protein HypB